MLNLRNVEISRRIKRGSIFDVFFSASRNTLWSAWRTSERRTRGEFIAHLARLYLEKSRGRKSVVNNSRRARFVAAYEICLVTGFSALALPFSLAGEKKGPFFPFLLLRQWYGEKVVYLRGRGWRREGNSGGREDRGGISAIRSFVDDIPARRSERARGEETAAASTAAAGPRGVVSLVLRSINTILLSARPVPCHTALRRAAPCRAVLCRSPSVRPSDRPWRVRESGRCARCQGHAALVLLLALLAGPASRRTVSESSNRRPQPLHSPASSVSGFFLSVSNPVSSLGSMVKLN